MSPIIPKYSSRGHVQRQLILFGRGEESNELNRNKLLAELNEWGENENLQPLLKFKDEKKKVIIETVHYHMVTLLPSKIPEYKTTTYRLLAFWRKLQLILHRWNLTRRNFIKDFLRNELQRFKVSFSIKILNCPFISTQVYLFDWFPWYAQILKISVLLDF